MRLIIKAPKGLRSFCLIEAEKYEMEEFGKRDILDKKEVRLDFGGNIVIVTLYHTMHSIIADAQKITI